MKFPGTEEYELILEELDGYTDEDLSLFFTEEDFVPLPDIVDIDRHWTRFSARLKNFRENEKKTLKMLESVQTDSKLIELYQHLLHEPVTGYQQDENYSLVQHKAIAAAERINAKKRYEYNVKSVEQEKARQRKLAESNRRTRNRRQSLLKKLRSGALRTTDQTQINLNPAPPITENLPVNRNDTVSQISNPHVQANYFINSNQDRTSNVSNIHSNDSRPNGDNNAVSNIDQVPQRRRRRNEQSSDLRNITQNVNQVRKQLEDLNTDEMTDLIVGD